MCEITQRAVSPVIGVVLLIALVVLLSATVSVFAIEMGQNNPEPTFLEGDDDDHEEPTPDVEWEIDASGGIAQITHDGGESIDGDALEIMVDGTERDGFDGTISEGDSTTVAASSGDEIRLEWTAGEESTTLESTTI